MKDFYQYLENVRNIILYESETHPDMQKLIEHAKTDYRYNKNIHVFKKYDDRLPDFLKVVLDENNWITGGRINAHRICFLVNYKSDNQEKYELYTFSSNFIPDNENYGVLKGTIEGWKVNNNKIEEIELNDYAKTLNWIYSNKIY